MSGLWLLACIHKCGTENSACVGGKSGQHLPGDAREGKGPYSCGAEHNCSEGKWPYSCGAEHNCSEGKGPYSCGAEHNCSADARYHRGLAWRPCMVAVHDDRAWRLQPCVCASLSSALIATGRNDAGVGSTLTVASDARVDATALVWG
eukprot:354884-Chlamydomonas_euryale.AAC.3